LAETTAQSIGWPAGNPFQSEVAVTNLTIATLGILCYWIRGSFWVATVTAFSVQWLGAAVILIALLVYYEHVKSDEPRISPIEPPTEQQVLLPVSPRAAAGALCTLQRVELS
jgi:hypothetical protein